MKKIIKLILCFSIALTSQLTIANPTHISDGFLGKANVGLDNNMDVFGGLQYEIDSFDVDIDFTTGYLTVDVNTYYADGDGYNATSGVATHNGDLFISTDGWNPYSVAGDCNGSGQCYNQDDYTNGENWEYGIVTTTGALMTGFSTILASSAYPVNNGRADQEVLIDTATGTTVGNSSSVDVSGQNQDINNATLGTIRYQVLLADLGLAAQDTFTLGFRWEMTCANDIIEGSATHIGGSQGDVSEPNILALFGFALLIPSFLYRRKKKA